MNLAFLNSEVTSDYEVLDNVLEVMGAKKDTRPLQLDPENSREQIKFELKQVAWAIN